MHWINMNATQHMPVLALLVSAMAVFIGWRVQQERKHGRVYTSTPVKVVACLAILASCFVLGVVLSKP